MLEFFFLVTAVLAVSDEFLSSLYLLHRVDLVSLQLQQLVDGIFLWEKRAAGKVTSGCNFALLTCQHVKWGKVLYSL